MKLFDLVLENTLDGAEELYVQGARAAEGAIALSDGESVSFRTYFNILSEEYARLCGIGSATLELEAEGDFRLDMFRYTSGGEKPIGSVFCSGNCSEEVPLEGKDAGYIYFTVTALGKCRVTGGRWTVQKQPEREVKIGMVICTYRRESFVETNIARIAEGLKSRPYMADRLHVFIVDNAGTLRLPESSFYTVIKNRNLGGSGGFTRGMRRVRRPRLYALSAHRRRHIFRLRRDRTHFAAAFGAYARACRRHAGRGDAYAGKAVDAV